MTPCIKRVRAMVGKSLLGRKFFPQSSSSLVLIEKARISAKQISSMERLPTRDEIAAESLDGNYAIEHFYGASLAQAEELFANSARNYIPLAYTEDLMWMEPIGFRFYVRAAIRFALADGATGECDFINGLAGAISFWHQQHPGELICCASSLADFCRSVVEQFDRYGANPEIYIGLRGKYQLLADTFTCLANGTENV